MNQPSLVSQRRAWCVMLSFGLALAGGCANPASGRTGPRVIFLDGAGWSGSHGAVEAGLRAGGFRGTVEDFAWTSLLGPGPDHLLISRKKRKGKQLAERIEKMRAEQPRDPILLMGLSAGTAVVVFALEQLPPGVQVDHVVLFSPSISERHDLSEAMKHVRGRLYATCSRFDGILAGIGVNADGEPGDPAGLDGLQLPDRVARLDLYARVVNLPWRPAYLGFGWNGGHTAVIGRTFVQRVIAPRVLTLEEHPLDRPLARGGLSSGNGRVGVR